MASAPPFLPRDVEWLSCCVGRANVATNAWECGGLPASLRAASLEFSQVARLLIPIVRTMRRLGFVRDGHRDCNRNHADLGSVAPEALRAVTSGAAAAAEEARKVRAAIALLAAFISFVSGGLEPESCSTARMSWPIAELERLRCRRSCAPAV